MEGPDDGVGIGRYRHIQPGFRQLLELHLVPVRIYACHTEGTAVTEQTVQGEGKAQPLIQLAALGLHGLFQRLAGLFLQLLAAPEKQRTSPAALPSYTFASVPLVIL